MTEGTPPPPPQPQQTQPPGTTFDFVKPFSFVFEDPRWLTKILIGGLFVLLSILIVGLFFVFGYMARLARNVIAGVTHPLPEWDDLGEYFVEGLKMAVIGLAYMAPMIILGIIIGIPGAVMSEAENEGLKNVGGCLMGSAWCLILPLSLAVTFFLPAGLLMFVTTGRMGAAFEFGTIWSFIRANIGNYLLAIVIYFVAEFASSLGLVLLCIGIIFTEFWSFAAQTFAFAQVYRLSAKR